MWQTICFRRREEGGDEERKMWEHGLGRGLVRQVVPGLASGLRMKAASEREKEGQCIGAPWSKGHFWLGDHPPRQLCPLSGFSLLLTSLDSVIVNTNERKRFSLMQKGKENSLPPSLS